MCVHVSAIETGQLKPLLVIKKHVPFNEWLKISSCLQTFKNVKKIRIINYANWGFSFELILYPLFKGRWSIGKERIHGKYFIQHIFIQIQYCNIYHDKTEQ